MRQGWPQDITGCLCTAAGCEQAHLCCLALGLLLLLLLLRDVPRPLLAASFLALCLLLWLGRPCTQRRHLWLHLMLWKDASWQHRLLQILSCMSVWEIPLTVPKRHAPCRNSLVGVSYAHLLRIA